MARTTKKTVSTVQTPEQQMQHAKEQLVHWDNTPIPLLPTPNRPYGITRHTL